METRSPLIRVRGHGSAHEGARHWWYQRITALSNLVLIGWFIAMLTMITDRTYDETRDFIAKPWNAALILLMLISVFTHIALGLRVVIEDYIHKRGLKLLALLASSSICVFACTSGILSVIKIALQ